LVALARAFVSGEILQDLRITLQRFIAGYAIASLVGIPLGLALGRWRILHASLEPVIEFFRPMPVIAVVPIAMFVLGLGDALAIAVIAFGSGWISLLYTMDGVRGVHPILVDTGRTFQIAGPRLFWQIVLPAASPQIMTGLRVSLSISLILAIVIELMVGFGGLGSFIGMAQGSVRIPETYAGIAVVGALGYSLNRIFRVFEARLLAWHLGYTKQ
jgi:ABC-type nitrate/sulfonate/bicarbonate transport system permease component